MGLVLILPSVFNKPLQIRLHGIKFLRQSPVLHYILDFYSSEVKLAIEIDGNQHYSLHIQTDNFRDQTTIANGY
jgi:very-short-patch-repair endonuclease